MWVMLSTGKIRIMSKQLQFLILLLAFAGSLAAGRVLYAGSISQPLQEWFIGSWRGTIIQANGGSYEGFFSFRSSEVGEVFGTSVYVELKCGGDLTLLSVNETNLEFQESITYGLSGCVSGLRKTITFSSTEAISYTISTGQGYQANAILSRVTTQGLSSYTGNWRGQIDQVNCCTYEGVFSFNETNIGEVFGASSYIELDCGGQLRLLSANESFLEFQEIITYGQSRCVNGLRKTITFVSTTSLNYEISSGQNISATALLSRFYSLYLPTVRK